MESSQKVSSRALGRRTAGTGAGASSSSWSTTSTTIMRGRSMVAQVVVFAAALCLATLVMFSDTAEASFGAWVSSSSSSAPPRASSPPALSPALREADWRVVEESRRSRTPARAQGAAAAAAAPSVEELVCPVGWTKLAYTPSSGADAVSAYRCAMVLSDAIDIVAPADSSVFCAEVLSLYPPRAQGGTGAAGNTVAVGDRVLEYDYQQAEPTPVSVHNSADNARVRQLFVEAVSASNRTTASVALGGVAGFGGVYWFDGSAPAEGSATAAYTNFAADVDWQTRSDCIGMRLGDGAWTLVPCRSDALPYMCLFDLTASLVHVHSAAGEDASASTSSGPARDSSASSSSSAGSAPSRSTYAQRPAVPQPAPACLPGWTAMPASVAASTTRPAAAAPAREMCFRVYSPAGEVGQYGRPFDAANSFCATQHPKATLANILSPAESRWVLEEVLLNDTRLSAIVSSAASATLAQRTVVFLGGNFMSVGADAAPMSLIGSWYGDAYAYRESDYTASFPSSPAWPTAANGYFSNWAATQPRTTSGCVAVAVRDIAVSSSSSSSSANEQPSASASAVTTIYAGQWVSADCRRTQPFLCSYLNDGSTFPPETLPPSTTPAPIATVDPETLCLAGWSLYAATGTCYRAWAAPASSDDAAATSAVSPATLEDYCGHVLSDLAENPEAAHSPILVSAEESVFVGSLLAGLPLEDANASSASAARVLAGVSYIESGSAGLYLDGTTNWVPTLAESLWATNEPARVQGCVAVDASGWWHYTSCGAAGAAYACQYRLSALRLKPPSSTLAPTGSPAPTRTPEPVEDLPLNERIAALSGAVHLVVAAGTTGTYTVDSRGGRVDGLLLYFAPVSPFFTQPESASALPSGQTPLASILFDPQTYAPCAGYKKQEELNAVLYGTVTVAHGRRTEGSASATAAPLYEHEVGYVCVSENGRDYYPTRITYEVVNTRLTGFIDVPERNAVEYLNSTNPLTGATSTAVRRRTTYLPPLFASAADALTQAQQSISLRLFSSGTLQLAVRSGSSDRLFSSSNVSASSGSSSSHEELVEDSYISHVRLSATADCMRAAFTLLERDIPVRDVSYYRAPDNASSSSSSPLNDPTPTAPLYALSYQWADVRISALSELDRLVSPVLPDDEVPINFFVCVAVRKRATGAAAMFAQWNAAASSASSSTVTRADELAFTNASTPLNLTVGNGVALKRLLAASSLSRPQADSSAANASAPAENQELRMYTAVPGIKVTVTAPPVTVRGWWAVAPQPLQRVDLAAVRTHNAQRPLQLRLRTPTTTTSSAGSSVDAYEVSTPSVRVPQYSSPVMILDAEGVGEGMSLLLSRADADGQRCGRTQPTSSYDGANADVPAALDTMLPISVLTVPIRVWHNATASFYRRKKIAFVQLNVNITGMWGTNASTDAQQTWDACFSYTTVREFLPVKPLRIIVDRLRITAVTVAGAEDDKASSALVLNGTTSSASAELNVNTGFSGLLRLWGMDTRMWSASTLANAQLTLSKALPASSASGGTVVDGDDIAHQCATPALFYRQRALGLVAPPSPSLLASNATSAAATLAADGDDAEQATTMLVIPPGFFADVSERRMRLCLSVPQPFRASRRAFYATAVTVDVRPVQILFIGPYSAVPSAVAGSTSAAPAVGAGSSSEVLDAVVRVAEDTPLVVFPLLGYGLRADMMVFLSRSACVGRGSAAVDSTDSIVAQQSVVNVTLVAPYDLPPPYRDAAASARTAAASSAASVYMVLSNDTLTSKAAADLTFGTERTPRRLCLYVPGSTDLVYSTSFRMVVRPPSTTTVSNLPKDDELVRYAMGNRTFATHQDPAVVSSSSSSSSSISASSSSSSSSSSSNGTRPSLYSLSSSSSLPSRSPASDSSSSSSSSNHSGSASNDASSTVIVSSESQYTGSGPNGSSSSISISSSWAAASHAVRRSMTPFSAVTSVLGAADAAAADESARAVVVYATYTDLLVDGFGLIEDQTEFIPAVDCGNASSFLWRRPVGLSPIPSSRGRAFFSSAERYIDAQTSTSSWFLSVRQTESVRLGAEDLVDGLLTRFQWCVRYRACPENTTAAAAASTDVTRADCSSAFTPTGVPYQLVVPRVDGLLFRGHVVQRITLPVQDKILGQWQKVQFVGPLIDITFDVGNPLYLFLADEALSCAEVKNYYVRHNLTAENIILAVNGTAVLLPQMLSNAGTYRFCASAVYPEPRSAELGTEAALQFFPLPGLRLELYNPMYGVFALNHSLVVRVEQGQEWTLPLTGSELSNHTLVRFKPRMSSAGASGGGSCNESMLAADGKSALPDIAVRNSFDGFPLFGVDAHGEGQYVALERDFLRALRAPVTYQLCYKANRATPWTVSAVTLRLSEHVRRPTHYEYFPADGSADVVSVSALAPTKVALPWLTGERGTDNLVGALGREVALALHCLDGHRPTADNGCDCANASSSNSSSSSSNSGVESCACDVPANNTVPCGTHRRVMFVKPLDDDEDPCFVDAEAVTDTIIRGPYVIDDGILTLPYGLSGAEVAQYPNLTQPWIMCLETGPEQWREPVYPLFQLQYTSVRPVGFRVEADDPSNTTALFPTASSAARANGVEAGDRTAEEGNSTLHLHAGDSDGVYYLNGYGVQRGFLLRFGARCDESLTAEQLAAANTSRLVARRQYLRNTLLYESPLRLEDDNGVFLVPRSHMLHVEPYVLPLCLSIDAGSSFFKTNLSVTVLSSRLKRDLPAEEEHLIDRILGETLLVPMGSAGSVNVSALASRAAAEAAAASSSSSGGSTSAGSGGYLSLGSSDDDTDDADAFMNGYDGSSNEANWLVPEDERVSTTVAPGSSQAEQQQQEDEAQRASAVFPAGTTVLLSSSCSVNVEGLPLLSVSTGNVLALTTRHTAVATSTRLRICTRAATATAARSPARALAGGGTTHEVDGTDDNGNNSGDAADGAAGQTVRNFKDTGIYFHVVGVSVGSVSVHAAAASPALESAGLSQMVLRRGAEDLLLTVALDSSNDTDAKEEESAAQSQDISVSACSSSSSTVSEDCVKETFLRMLNNAAGGLPFFSLARFRVGKPCGDVSGSSSSSSSSGTAALSTSVLSPTAYKATFDNSSLRVAGLYGGHRVAFVAPLPSPSSSSSSSSSSSTSAESDAYPPWSPASLCFSVDGGLHYLSVGIAYFTADWAPTLKVQLNPTDSFRSSSSSSSSEAASTPSSSASFASDLVVHEQASLYAPFTDTRFDAAIYDDPTRRRVTNVCSGSSSGAAESNNNNNNNSSSSSSNSSRGFSSSSCEVVSVGASGAAAVPFALTAANLYLNRFTVEVLWTGFLSGSGYAGRGIAYLPSTLTLMDTDDEDALVDTVVAAPTMKLDLVFYARNRFLERGAVAGGSGGESTGLTLTVEPQHLDCIGDDDFTVEEDYVRRLDNGRLLPVSRRCGGGGLPEGTTIRVVDSHGGTVSAAEACAGSVAYSASSFAFDMPVVKPSLWAPVGSSVAAAAATASEATTNIQLGAGLRYVPDGLYHLCVKKPLWSYRLASRLQAEAVFVPSRVRLLVTANLTVLRVAHETSGIIAVYQGTNTQVSMEGTAVGLRGLPLLMAMAPVVPHNVTLRSGEVLELSHGCDDVPLLRDPVTGDSLVELNAFDPYSNSSRQGPPEDILLTSPWQNAQDGLWRVPAAYLRYITNQTLYFLCYSVDNGLSFAYVENTISNLTRYDEADDSADDSADGAPAPTPRVVTIAVRPPTMVGLALNASARGVVADDLYVGRAQELSFDPGWSSASTLRVQRLISSALPSAAAVAAGAQTSGLFVSNNSLSAADAAQWAPSPAQPARVLTATDGVSSTAGSPLLSRIPSYYYNPTSSFAGNGMGANAYRDWWPTSTVAVHESSSSSSSGLARDSERDRAPAAAASDHNAWSAADDRTFDDFFGSDAVSAVPDATHGTDAESVPTVAAAVAVLRTSRFGQICSGALPNTNVSVGVSNTTTGVLATPLFLVNLRRTTVWSAADTEAYATALAALRAAAPALATVSVAMNPVLSRADLLENTAALRRLARGDDAPKDSLASDEDSGENAALSFQAVLAMATTAAAATHDVIGESLLVCVSVDGVNFFSANAHVLPSVGSLANAAVAVPGVNSDAARQSLRLKRLRATAPSNRPIALVNVSSVPLFIRPETAASPMGSFLMRDLSLRAAVVVRPNLTALQAADGAAAVGQLSASQWAAALSVVPSPSMVARFVEQLSRLVSVEAAVLAVRVQPTAPVQVPGAAVTGLSASSVARATALMDAAVRRSVRAAESAATTATESLALPTYNVLVSVVADAYFVNTTTQARTLISAPRILMSVVEALRDNATQLTALHPLLHLDSAGRAGLQELDDDAGTVRGVRGTAYVSTVALNFTFSNGVDLHRVVVSPSTSSAAAATARGDVVTFGGAVNITLPSAPASELTWRRSFLAVPHDAVAAVVIPDDPSNDSSGKITWWVVPLLLIFPVLLFAGTYLLYKKYLKTAPEEADGATEVTVEAAH